MPLRTKLTEMLGIEHPIVQEIRKCKQLTAKPFGVNLTLLPVGGAPDYQAYAQVIIDEVLYWTGALSRGQGVKIVETAGRNPEEWIKLFKANGVIVIHKYVPQMPEVIAARCVAIRHALTAQRHGADILSVDGFECGGHPGEEDVPNFILLARAAEELRIPFIASGGMANGAQLAAALALGAEGINCGTRFMATVEAPIHQNIKQALVDADERKTTHIFRTLGNTERVYKNKTAEEVRSIEAEFPGEFEKIRHLVLGVNYKDSFHSSGNTESSVWSCGQSMGLIHDIPTCQDLCAKIVADAEAILTRRLPPLVRSRL